MPAPAGSSAFTTAARRGLVPAASASNRRPLGACVLLQRTVEVQVVLGEVGEHRHVELGAVHARQSQRVRGHFHGRAGDAAVAHARQQRLELHRLRRRLARLHRLIAHAVLDGADETGAVPGRAQEGLHQEGGGGLAVGARDPDQGQRTRGVSPVGVGQSRQGLARDGHEHARGGLARQRVGALCHHQGRAARESVGDEAAAVLLEARAPPRSTRRGRLSGSRRPRRSRWPAECPAPSCPAARREGSQWPREYSSPRAGRMEGEARERAGGERRARGGGLAGHHAAPGHFQAHLERRERLHRLA